MRDRKPASPLLTYCMNVHPGESLDAVEQNLKKFAAPIGRSFQGDAPFGVGLRLSHESARELMRPGRLKRFREILTEQNLYIYTINGFPAGRFSGPGLKENVYLPDWTERDRLDYTLLLGKILAFLLPEKVAFGSISTLPGGFKTYLEMPDDPFRVAAGLVEAAAAFSILLRETGREVVLALEPEPACFLETTEETIRFFQEFLLSPAFLRLFSERTSLPPEQCRAELLRHLGVCLDTCHSAIQFEDPLRVLQDFRSAGIRIAKIQLSSALEVDPSRTLRNGSGPLDEFFDPVFLHQVVSFSGEMKKVYRDLPGAMADYRKRKREGHETLQKSEIWRIHFHVPLFFEGGPLLRTTRFWMEEILALMAGEPELFFPAGSHHGTRPLPHLEVETYTWSVLPSRVRGEDPIEDIVRELRVVRQIQESFP